MVANEHIETTLPEMLSKLSRERLSGTLTVRAADGWKVIELQAGAITLASGSGGKRLRIGELLVARGKITNEQLIEALDESKRQNQQLGEYLLAAGRINRRDIQDILKFQVEEELYDLFTWHEASCTFEEGSTFGDELEGIENSSRLMIDPRTIFQEASRRIPLWNEIKKTIYSSYAIFQLTDRARTMMSTSTSGAKRLLELVDAGYCVDSIVRIAMLGRFTIWKALADLVTQQIIFPVTEDQLPELADIFEESGDLEQAWGVCMLLAQVGSNSSKHTSRAAEIQKRIEDEQHAKMVFGATLSISSKGRSILKGALTFILLVVIGLGAALGLSKALLPEKKNPADTAAFTKTERAIKRLMLAEKYNEAVEKMDTFLAMHKEGDNASLGRNRHKILMQKYERLFKEAMKGGNEFLRLRRFDDAIKHYKKVEKDFPYTKNLASLRAQIKKATKLQLEQLDASKRNELTAELLLASEAVRTKSYQKAYNIYTEVHDSKYADATQKGLCASALSNLRTIKTKIQNLHRSAKQYENKRQFSNALATYLEATKVWPELEMNKKIMRRIAELKLSQDESARLLTDGKTMLNQGNFAMAENKFKEASQFDGFRHARIARDLLIKMQDDRRTAALLLEKAAQLKDKGKLNEAFQVRLKIYENHIDTSIARNLKLELSIDVVPGGVNVRLNGKDIGLAPITTLIKPSEPLEFVFSKKGFQTKTISLPRATERVVSVNLQREIFYKTSLGVKFVAPPLFAQSENIAPRLFLRTQNSIILLDAITGRPLKAIDLPAPKQGASILFHDDKIITTSHHSIEILSLNGKRVHSIPLPAEVSTELFAEKLTLVAGRSFVFVGCADGKVNCVDITDRTIRWNYSTRGIAIRAIALAEEKLFVAYDNGSVHAVDMRTGRRRWRQSIPGRIGSNLSVADGKLCLVSSIGEFIAISANRGLIDYRQMLTEMGDAKLSAQNNIAIIGAENGAVYAINYLAKRLIWQKAASSPIRAMPLLTDDSTVVVNEAGICLWLNLKNGEENWRVTLKAPLELSPSLSKEMMFLATREGEVLAIQRD